MHNTIEYTANSEENC